MTTVNSLFEYKTFVLSQYPHPLAQHEKILADLKQAKRFFGGNKKQAKMLEAALADFNSTYDLAELKADADNYEVEFWISKLAKQSAVELLSTGKVSVDTMTKMSSLSSENFIECVKQATLLADKLNKTVKAAEQSVNLDTVPADLMK